MKVKSAIVLAWALVAAVAGADDLSIARAALRDGLWDIARAHAAKIPGDDGRAIILESYAHEGKWDKVLSSIDEWKGPQGGLYDYYRAAATGDYKLASSLLRKSNVGVAIVDAKMLEAGMCAEAGDRATAKKLWREVVADTNSSERAFAVASANLGDAELLRRAHGTVKSSTLKLVTGLRLGMALLGDGKTEGEGAKLIRAIVKDSPDAAGSREAFFALAENALAKGRWEEAGNVFHEIAETWPDSVKTARLQNGRGWAALKMGRLEDALEAFRMSETASAAEGDKAMSMLKQGDVLSRMGKESEAMAKYREVIAKYPKADAAGKLKVVVRLHELEQRGREEFRQYRYAEAQKTFAEVAKLDAARKPRMQYFDILCLYGQGEDGQAERKALELVADCEDDKVRADAMLWIAKFLYNRGEWKTACQLFSEYAELVPKSSATPEALLWAARSAMANSDYKLTIQMVTRLAERYPGSPIKASALLIQGEALIELARFDEAVLVLEQVSLIEAASAEDRMRAQILRADAMYAMGADNAERYLSALDAYRSVQSGGSFSPSVQLQLAFKVARTLDKLKRIDDAVEIYYSQVLLAYFDGRRNGIRFDDDARSAFSRAAFRLAEEYERRGRELQLRHILELVAASDVPAAEETKKRLEALSKKGRFL